MKLLRVQIQNFKCVLDSGSFTIDPNVTCLVGKNESGKTAILQAIEKLNPIRGKDAAFDDLEFPRSRLSEFRDRPANQNVDALITTWSVDAEDVAAVSEVLGDGVLQPQEITISKGYYDTTTWAIEHDEDQAIRNLIESSELHDEEKLPLRALDSIASVFESLQSRVAAGTPNATNARSPREDAFLSRLRALLRGNKSQCWNVIVDILQKRLPKMVYFSEYFRMPGQVSLSDLKTRREASEEPGNRVFEALLGMIGRNVDDLEDIGEFERLQAELEAASNRLTKEIFRYWTQNNHLRVQFRFEQALPKDPAPFNTGFVMRTRIENTRHGVSTSFDDRSAGFVWFFSFLVWFSQVRKNYGDNLIFLLDEPGLSLHAKAQADLLRYIDERLSGYQVLYTTHSPFLIDATRILRTRTVEDIYRVSNDPKVADEEIGTRVGEDVLSTDRDTLFPLQAALGYDITQTLFVGKHTLLVEGPSELLYLPWFSRKLQSLGRSGIDARWTLTPCGGIDKIPSFLSLFSGQSLHIATFTDIGDGSRRRVRELKEREVLKAGRVFTAADYVNQAEADIEDMIGRSMYVDLINQCFGLSGAEVMSPVRPDDAPLRVVKEVEEHFRTVATTGAEFDHFAPSLHLTTRSFDQSWTGLDEALDRFEQLFRDVNGVLPPYPV